MRVLMITPRLPTPSEPGTMAPVARQIESLRAAGADVDVLEVRGIRRLKYLQSFWRLWRMVPAADLIHAHYGYCGWLARAQIGTPVVVSFMGDDLLGTPDASGRAEPLSRLVVQADRWLARLVDAVIVKSAEMAGVVAPVRCHVIPNGVDLASFRPLDAVAARAMLGWPADARYVLFAGDPANPRKGFALAEAAVAHARTRTAEPIEVAVLADVAPDDVATLMNACDVLLMTSLWEGSPNVVKEAMACDLPIVSVPVGDVPELLDGVEGGTVRPRDPVALGDALVGVLMRPERPPTRAALIHKGLDMESVARRVMAVYREVLGRREGSRRKRRVRRPCAA